MTIAFNYPIICMHFLNKKNIHLKANSNCVMNGIEILQIKLNTREKCWVRGKDFVFNPPVLISRAKAIFLRYVHLGALKRKHEHLKTIKILNRTLAERQEQSVAVCARNVFECFDERLISEK